MFPIPLRDMEISVTLTRPCTCVGSARYLTSLQLSFSLFPSEQNLLSSENIPEMVNAACLAAPGSPASLPMYTCARRTTPHPLQALLQVSKTARTPLQVHDLPWDGCSVQAKTGLLLTAEYKLAFQKTRGAFWNVCLKPFVFLQHVTAAALTGCRTGRGHLPTPTPSKKCYLLILGDWPSAPSTWLRSTSSLPGRWEKETGLIIKLDIPQRRLSRWGLGGRTD